MCLCPLASVSPGPLVCPGLSPGRMAESATNTRVVACGCRHGASPWGAFGDAATLCFEVLFVFRIVSVIFLVLPRASQTLFERWNAPDGCASSPPREATPLHQRAAPGVGVEKSSNANPSRPMRSAHFSFPLSVTPGRLLLETQGRVGRPHLCPAARSSIPGVVDYGPSRGHSADCPRQLGGPRGFLGQRS